MVNTDIVAEGVIDSSHRPVNLIQFLPQHADLSRGFPGIDLNRQNIILDPLKWRGYDNGWRDHALEMHDNECECAPEQEVLVVKPGGGSSYLHTQACQVPAGVAA